MNFPYINKIRPYIGFIMFLKNKIDANNKVKENTKVNETVAK